MERSVWWMEEMVRGTGSYGSTGRGLSFGVGKVFLTGVRGVMEGDGGRLSVEVFVGGGVVDLPSAAGATEGVASLPKCWSNTLYSPDA